MTEDKLPQLHLGRLVSQLDSAFAPHMHATRLDLKHRAIQDGFAWLSSAVRSRKQFSDPAEVAHMAFAGSSLLQWDPDWKMSEECASLVHDLDRYFGKRFLPDLQGWKAMLLAFDFLHAAAPSVEQKIFKRHLADVSNSFVEQLSSLSEATDLHLWQILARVGRLDYSGLFEANVMDDAVNSRDVYISAEAIIHVCLTTNLLPASVVSRVEFLRPWISDLAPNPSNFVSICVALKAIALSDKMESAPVPSGRDIDAGEQQRSSRDNSQQRMEQKLTELLAYGQRADGSWFGSVWQTAWLLQAASSVHAIRTLVIPVTEVSRALALVGEALHAREREAIIASRHVRTRIVPLLVGLVLVLIALVAGCIWALLNVDVVLWLAIVGALGLATIVGVIGRRVLSLWKRTQIYY